ncbi:glutathione S-transferase C-terminal domain-containing protein [Microlunatus flavus]|uniref:Putative glutathione S-transferase n=1 Tax=Microlunatus flavus TaxID=1036181 RepID=A0A1H9N7T6_9ACTN|nr:glutathione S-transferase C-terminal domain-containing protein [Microlunatus flavus]SER31871.1 putative glutathione S-transferase [Microlunatus flavus]
MTLSPPRPAFAGAADLATYGPYRNPQRPDDPRPLYRFTGRLSADGSTGFQAEAGRYHLYASWTCPWSQRVVLELAVNGLLSTVGVSYVDDVRDGRGWAFREADGPDPVNGFTFLREAYEVTEPGFDGLVNVPALWDTKTLRIVSNDYATLGIDVATQFPGYRTPGIDTYPVEHRAEIDALDAWLGPAVNHGLGRAAGGGQAAPEARSALLAALDALDDRLADGGFLVGHGITEADIRLWVTLARYDSVQVGPPLTAFRHLARYAAWLAELPAFRTSTRWASIGGTPSFLPTSTTDPYEHPRRAQ